MKLVSTLLFTLLLYVSWAQEKNDIGISLGSSNYIGDLNPALSYSNAQPTFGLLIRHNASNYYSLRVAVSMAGLSTTPSNTNSYLPGSQTAFAKMLYEGELIAEIGFLPFNTKIKTSMNFSPYVIAGIGAASIDGVIFPHIPLGIGAKYSFRNRLSLAIELRLHKTGNDLLDNYVNVSTSRSTVHNNDWFTFAGIMLSYRIYNKKGLCPVYR